MHITLDADGKGGGVLIQGTEDELLDLADAMTEAARRRPGQVLGHFITDNGVETFTIERIESTP